MSRTCTICSHAERQEIEDQLVSGQSYRHITQRFDTSPAALVRHSRHIAESLEKSADVRQLSYGESLLEEIRGLHGKTLTILIRAENAGDLRTALSAIREARANQEFIAKVYFSKAPAPLPNYGLPSLEETVAEADRVFEEYYRTR